MKTIINYFQEILTFVQRSNGSSSILERKPEDLWLVSIFEGKIKRFNIHIKQEILTKTLLIVYL